MEPGSLCKRVRPARLDVLTYACYLDRSEMRSKEESAHQKVGGVVETLLLILARLL